MLAGLSLALQYQLHDYFVFKTYSPLTTDSIADCYFIPLYRHPIDRLILFHERGERADNRLSPYPGQHLAVCDVKL